jgi:paraquat-inducible protein B
MTEWDPLAHARTKEPDLPLKQPEVRRRRFSPIWILPVVAVLVAGWLAYTALADKGPVITITFRTASGLEVGKTQIKYHDIVLGVIKHIEPNRDLSQIIVTAQMDKRAEPHLRDDTHFWVVRPRLSLTNFSGLETLVSGNYIEIDPGRNGAARHEFTGLEEPPVVRSDEPGTTYVVTTTKGGSLSASDPVFFRGITVGDVISYSFDGTQKEIPIRIFVKKPYDALIKQGTTFWNASGMTVSAGADGFKFELESLTALLSGGIAFETPATAQDAAPAMADTVFPLYDNRSAAIESAYKERMRLTVVFSGSVKGLEAGAPVMAQGLPIGRVVDFRLVVDAAAHTARVPVVVELDVARLGIVNQPTEEIGKGNLLRRLVALGLRAQLRSSSLITGSLYVAFDFFPDAPPAEVAMTDPYPTMPTVPTDMENITRSVSQVLDKVAALPLDQVASDVRDTLGAAQKLLRDADTRTGPLLASLQETSQAAQLVLKSLGNSYGSESQIRGELANLLRQLQDTARSVKALASYLEQHPESLIRGKAAQAQ